MNTKCEYCEQVKKIIAKGYCNSCYQRYRKNGTPEYQKKGKRSVCTVEDCDKFVVSHGLCDKHRKRLTRHGHLKPTRPNDWGDREKHPLYSAWTGLRRFRKKQLCHEWHSDFWLFVKRVKTKPSKNHYLRPIDEDALIRENNWHWVEKASTNTEDQKAYSREWIRKDRENNPDKYRDKSLKKQFGIGLDEYKEILEKQDGVCAICHNKETALNPLTKEPRELAVDHCHTTGKIRGLLCTGCNTALGLLKDSTELLRKAILYLKG